MDQDEGAAARPRKNEAPRAIPFPTADTLIRRMTDSKNPLPIDPKDLVPAGVGVVLGVALILGFVLLATSIGLTLFVDFNDMPRQ